MSWFGSVRWVWKMPVTTIMNITSMKAASRVRYPNAREMPPAISISGARRWRSMVPKVGPYTTM